MEYIIILIILGVSLCAFNYKKSSKIQQSNIAEEDYMPNTVKTNISHERWKIEYEQKISEETERLNNGYYNKYRMLQFNIAGIHYRTNLAKDTISTLDILSEIHLIKDPDNPYDRYAVKVVYDKKRLGYVPVYDSQQVSKLIDFGQIRKVLVIDSGKDLTSGYSDALFVEIRIYFEPTAEELMAEQIVEQEKKEKLEAKEKRMLEPVIYPDWMLELINSISSINIESDSKKWELKKLKANIRNSVKSYEKAIREEKDSIAKNASKRLIQYKEELDKLLSE